MKPDPTKCGAFGGTARLRFVPGTQEIYCTRAKEHKGFHTCAPFGQLQVWKGSFLKPEDGPVEIKDLWLLVARERLRQEERIRERNKQAHKDAELEEEARLAKLGRAFARKRPWWRRLLFWRR